MKNIQFMTLTAFCFFSVLGCQDDSRANSVYKPQNQEAYQSQEHDFEAQSLVQGLDHPWGMTFLDQSNVLITQRSGGMRLVNLREQTLQEIQGVPAVHARGQGGLFDIVLHPDFAENGLIYFSYARTSETDSTASGTVLAQARLQDHTLENVKILFAGTPVTSSGQHYGGRLAVDNEFIYLSLGDRGTREWAQDRSNHWGSMIRLTLDGNIPEDNPFVGDTDSQASIYTYGNRNPQGLAWHPTTNELWQHEHGPQGGDEINIMKAGANYGWPEITYGKEYGTGFDIGEGVTEPGVQAPLYQWTPSIAPSGMAFYTGEAFPQWRHNLIVGSLKFQKLVRLELDGTKVTKTEDLLTDEFGRIRDVEVAPDGTIFLLTDESNGELVQLRPK